MKDRHPRCPNWPGNTHFVRVAGLVFTLGAAMAACSSSNESRQGGSDSGAGGSAAGDSGAGEAAAGSAVGWIGGSSGTESEGGLCSFESCWSKCTVPVLPGYSALSANSFLPDPFMMISGTRMTSFSQWECRRAEIAAQLEDYELGAKYPKPAGTVTGSVSGTTMTVNVGGSSFTETITLPTTGTAPYPAMIALDGGSLPASSITGKGVALISFDTNAMGDQSGSDRGAGFFFQVNGADSGAGALVAWAWGVSRLIDALETTPATMIDTKHLGVTGCSRNGKGALMIGALDQRIALTIPQESGSGGDAGWRTSDVELAADGADSVQTLGEIVGENTWFSTALDVFAANHAATKLPYDHHAVLGLVAPRGLLDLENTSYEWLGVMSTTVDATAARLIFQGLGVEENMGFSNTSHTHCDFNPAETPYLDAFIAKFLLGQTSTSTAVWNVTSTAWQTSSSVVSTSDWVNWTVPTLKDLPDSGSVPANEGGADGGESDALGLDAAAEASEDAANTATSDAGEPDAPIDSPPDVSASDDGSDGG